MNIVACAVFVCELLLPTLRPTVRLVHSPADSHVFCPFLALLLRKEAEDRMEANELEWADVVRDLDALQAVESKHAGQRFAIRTEARGGFGNLIALPLQGGLRAQGKSVFLSYDVESYEDQWAYLSSIRRISRTEADGAVAASVRNGSVLGVRGRGPGRPCFSCLIGAMAPFCPLQQVGRAAVLSSAAENADLRGGPRPPRADVGRRDGTRGRRIFALP